MVWGRAVEIGQDDGEYPAARGADSAEKERDRGPAGAAGPAERAEPAAAAAARRVRVGMGWDTGWGGVVEYRVWGGCGIWDGGGMWGEIWGTGWM